MEEESSSLRDASSRAGRAAPKPAEPAADADLLDASRGDNSDSTESAGIQKLIHGITGETDERAKKMQRWERRWKEDRGLQLARESEEKRLKRLQEEKCQLLKSRAELISSTSNRGPQMTGKRCRKAHKENLYNVFVNVALAGPMGVMRLPGGVEWLCGNLGGEPLFARPRYQQLYDEMMARASARDNRRCAGLILIGNPGIGKSCFLSCALIRLLKEGKAARVCAEELGEGCLFRDRRCRWRDKDALPNEAKHDAEAFQLLDPPTNGHGPRAQEAFLRHRSFSEKRELARPLQIAHRKAFNAR